MIGCWRLVLPADDDVLACLVLPLSPSPPRLPSALPATPGYVVYDTQVIVERSEAGACDELRDALSLYTDFVAIFVRLLVILLRSGEGEGGRGGGGGGGRGGLQGKGRGHEAGKERFRCRTKCCWDAETGGEQDWQQSADPFQLPGTLK